MVDQKLPSPSIDDFATWAPVLRLLVDNTQDRHGAASVRVSGRIGRNGWSLAVRRPRRVPGRAAQVEDVQDEFDAAQRVQTALADAGINDISFRAEVSTTGRTVLHLLGPSPAVEPGIGSAHPGALILVQGSVSEPWRRSPEPVPAAVPAPSVDLAVLERTLRERLPDAVGATQGEIAATEARLGVSLPEELKVLYRVTRARWEDWGDYESASRVYRVVGCELFPLDDLYIADAASRHFRWQFGAKDAVVTGPGAAVQGLVGSPGWIAFGDNGGGDRLAVDLTPGPRGHLGQIIMLSHEESTGADLLADSLTDLVLEHPTRHEEEADPGLPPAVAHVNVRSVPSLQAAAHPGLEVLSIGVWEDQPVSLAPVTGLPRLRTLAAYPGTLADPLEIANLTGLEFLELGPQEWRVLLDEGAVPRGLSAAAVTVHGQQDPLAIVAIANDILALWDRPQIIQTIIEGDLDPLP